jgi:hypothetical protein
MIRLPALTFAALLSAATPAAQEPAAGPELKEADHRKLGRHFGKWLEGMIDKDYKQIEDAKAELLGEIADFDKKLKDRATLSLVRDWEVILDLGREYATSGPVIKKGKAFELHVSDAAGKCGARLPSAYNPKKENYPGILILTTGKTVEAIEALPEEIKESFILLGVDLTGLDAETFLSEAGRNRLIGPIGAASLHYRLDRKRLFLLGQGDLGASAASRLAAAYPLPFAACALVGGVSTAGANAGNHKLLPFESKGDTAAAVAWFQSLPPRAAYPLQFEATLTESWQGRYHWVQALRFDPPDAVPAGKAARFKVAVDRATNTITIDAEYAYRFDIFLNDEIVDLSKEVKIVRNGEPLAFQATRSVANVLEHFGNSLDAGLYFPAMIRSVDVPAAAGPQVRSR